MADKSTFYAKPNHAWETTKNSTTKARGIKNAETRVLVISPPNVTDLGDMPLLTTVLSTK